MEIKEVLHVSTLSMNSSRKIFGLRQNTRGVVSCFVRQGQDYLEHKKNHSLIDPFFKVFVLSKSTSSRDTFF